MQLTSTYSTETQSLNNKRPKTQELELVGTQAPKNKRAKTHDLDAVDTSNDPWNCVNSTILFRNNDAQFWWNTTGRMFAKLIQHAGYTATEQYRELIFYALFVAPELGPSPDENGEVRRWRSPGTPDSTPIDFSWEFGTGNNGVVRYSFEPIGPLAGTKSDPLNQYATDKWIARLQQQNMVPGLDLEWYKHFTQQVLPFEERKRSAEDFVEETTPKGGTVVALDIEKTGPVMKMYIYPGLKAEELGISNLDLVIKAIRNLPTEQYKSLSVEPLLEYLQKGTEKYGFETGILGIDCLAPKDARIKIYVRARHTSLEYLMDALTLGGMIDMTGQEEALSDLRDFWQTFLADAPDALPEDIPGRASPGFYYTVGCGKAVSPKMYLSPQFFCESDADVLARLRKYFSTHRSKELIDSYEEALKVIFGNETLEKRCGSHYYIGCALHKNQLRLVTYLSPQAFDCEKDLIQLRRP